MLFVSAAPSANFLNCESNRYLLPVQSKNVTPSILLRVQPRLPHHNERQRCDIINPAMGSGKVSSILHYEACIMCDQIPITAGCLSSDQVLHCQHLSDHPTLRADMCNVVTSQSEARVSTE